MGTQNLTIRLDPNNCGLAYLDGFGYGSKMPFEKVDPSPRDEKNFVIFEEMMAEFDKDEGRFRNTGQGPYTCPTRRALMASLTPYQVSKYGDLLAKHGWVKIAAFNNTKKTGSGEVHIFFRVHKDGTIEAPVPQVEDDDDDDYCDDPDCGCHNN